MHHPFEFVRFPIPPRFAAAAAAIAQLLSMLYIWILTLAIVGTLMYNVLVYPYLQYRYYLGEAQRDPKLLIDLPPKFVPFFGDLIRQLDSIKQNDDPFILLREAIKTRARFSIAFIGCIPRITILDADVIQDVLSASKFHSTGVSNFSATVFGMLVPKSFIAMEGLQWQQRRPVFVPVFRYPMMKVYGDAISEMTQTNLDRLQKLMPDEIDFVALFKRWTLAVIGTCAFGGAFSTDSDSDKTLAGEAIDALTIMVELCAEYVFKPVNVIPGATWLPTPARLRLRSSIKRCQAIADEVIRLRLQGQKSLIHSERDLLDVLLSYKSEETGESLSLEDIRDECLLFIFAGHETTANLLSWLFVMFSQHADILEQCREEVRTGLTANQTTVPTESDIKSMPFLHSCLLETLRLYPPVLQVGRQTRVPCDLGGLRVPAGTLLRIDTWGMHHNPKYWKDPEVFDPHRFLRCDEQGDLVVRLPSEVHSHAFVPFGHGVRNCPGQAFALLEARLIVAALLARFHVQFSPGQKFPVKLALTSSPKYGVFGRLVPNSV